jgi:hypothetical protein
MDRINIKLKRQEAQNIQQMCLEIREGLLTYRKNFTGFLDWRYVVCSLGERKLAGIHDSSKEIFDFQFEVYEVESMIMMVKWLSQQKNNEFLMLKLIDSIFTYMLLPSGIYQDIIDWYTKNTFIKEYIFDNKSWIDLDVYEVEYLKERFAGAKAETPLSAVAEVEAETPSPAQISYDIPF